MGYFSFKEEQDSIRNIVITDPNVLGTNFGPRLHNGEFDSITINYQIKMEYNPLNPDVCLGSNSPFSGLNTLKRITCPIILGEQVESTAGMFNGCSSLEEVPLFDTSRVKDMNHMFLGCTQLKEIPAFDTSSCNNMSGMFCGCGSLKTIPKLDTSKVWNMSSMFMNAVALTTIPALDMSSVVSASAMFLGATALTRLPLMDTSHVSDVSRMFMSCRALEEIPEFDFSGAKNMAEMFFNCPYRKRNPVLNSPLELTQDITKAMEEGTLKTLTLNYDTTKRTSPFAKMDRKSRKKLKEINFKIIPGVRVRSLRGLFYNLKNLKKAPLIDTSHISDMSSMFEGCSELERVPLYNISKASDLRRMFAACGSLDDKPNFKLDDTVDTKDMYASALTIFIKDTAYRFRHLPKTIALIIWTIIAFIFVMLVRFSIFLINIIFALAEAIAGPSYDYRLRRPFSQWSMRNWWERD